MAPSAQSTARAHRRARCFTARQGEALQTGAARSSSGGNGKRSSRRTALGGIATEEETRGG
eukprot:4378477-Pyramimonas_sp.AAC.1